MSEATTQREKLLEINHLKKYFHVKNGLLHAVDDVSFYIEKGETLGLVGESGCGKSTTGRTIIRLLEADGGEVIFHGKNIHDLNATEMKDFRRHVQMVFQDPYSSLNPRLSIFDLIAEPLTNQHEYQRDKAKLEARVKELMDIVGLSHRLINAYPHELDGGRRQRVGIARALSVNPDFIVLDEPVSALDVSVQARLLDLLRGLVVELNLAVVIVTHDLGVARLLADRLLVMKQGQVVESGLTDRVLDDPHHPYTQLLVSSVLQN